MPSSVTSYNPKGHKCTFTEDDHRYVIDEDPDNPFSEVMSVTTLVHQFCKEFDTNGCAARVAEREGKTAQEVLSEWDAKKNHACTFGTRVHETAEDCILGRKPRNVPINDKEKQYFFAVWDFASRLTKSEDVYGVEKMVFSKDLQLAGTIDLLTKDSKGFIINDWKTNENLMKPAYGTLTHPFTHLQDDSLTKYALQLSVYRLLLHYEGYVTEPLHSFRHRLFWIHESNNGAVVDVVDVPYYGEAAMMIALRSSTKWHDEFIKRLPF